MNKKLAIGALFILTIFISATFINTASAKSGANSDETRAQVSTTIVISQVYGGGGATSGTPTYAKDYVELKNISSSPQSLNGLSLMYGSATGQFASSSTNAFALPDVTLQPGQYYLVELGAVGTVGGNLPVTADASTTNLSMSGVNGKVALTNGLTPNTCGASATPCTLPNPQIIDLVAYGTANNAEGGAAVGALSTTSGAVRKNNGCQDTDNNSNDFDIVEPPVPHNSASPAAPCGTVVTPSHTRFDFDGDGKADVSTFRPSNGTWYLNRSTAGFTGVQFGDANDKIVPADFDGDGKTDIAVYRPSNGTWYIQRSTAGFIGLQFGAATDIALAADYTGDGKADLVVWRPSTGIWYVYNLVTSQYTAFQLGASTDKPVVGDFDGDGKADYAVFRPSNGTWYIQGSTAGYYGFQFGDGADSPVPADYDGDGKTDIAVYRPSNGVWYIQRSTAGFIGTQFGVSTDIPVPADYDGDGKADLAVFRPSNGTWYIQQSASNLTGVVFGAGTDKPVPSAYIF